MIAFAVTVTVLLLVAGITWWIIRAHDLSTSDTYEVYGDWQEVIRCHCGHVWLTGTSPICPRCGCRTPDRTRVVMRQEWTRYNPVYAGGQVFFLDATPKRWVEWTGCTNPPMVSDTPIGDRYSPGREAKAKGDA